MTRDTAPVLTDLPTGPRWDYGGFCYGLEPLTLPQPGTAELLAGYDPPDRYTATCDRIRLIGDFGVDADEVERPPGDAELFWFRWITGHQVSFIIWRMMALVLREVAEGHLAMADAVRPLSQCIRGYCAMLLYSGSCPQQTYEEVIRPSMRLRHPSFSGGWAPDFWPVRDVFRAKRSAFSRSAESAELLQAVRLHQLVHDGVAARLVPDGRSLLRQSSAPRQDIRLLNLIYDNYFLTLRGPVPHRDVVAQLLRRLVAIVQDLAVNDLYRPGNDSHRHLEEFRAAEVMACESQLVEILAEVGECAAGLTESYGIAPVPAGNGRSVTLTH